MGWNIGEFYWWRGAEPRVVEWKVYVSYVCLHCAIWYLHCAITCGIWYLYCHIWCLAVPSCNVYIVPSVSLWHNICIVPCSVCREDMSYVPLTHCDHWLTSCMVGFSEGQWCICSWLCWEWPLCCPCQLKGWWDQDWTGETTILTGRLSLGLPDSFITWQFPVIYV